MENIKIKIKLDKGAKAPERAHLTDAGADIFANESLMIPSNAWRNVHTGVHIELPKGYFGLLQSKSGLNMHHGITCRGVIDEGYSGEIICAVQNIGPAYVIKKGEKITQLIIVPCLYADFDIADEIKCGDRGENGFGSTGK